MSEDLFHKHITNFVLSDIQLLTDNGYISIRPSLTYNVHKTFTIECFGTLKIMKKGTVVQL